jgi:3-oxoadipate enol-lactonase
VRYSAKDMALSFHHLSDMGRIRLAVVLPTGRSRRREVGLLSGGSHNVLGESLYCEASGTGEDGPTLLFLHESGGTGATWRAQLAGLAKGAHCLAPDLPGHGRSEGGGYPSVVEYRMVVLGLLDALAIRWPVVLAGVCLGAAVAVDLARHAPDRVAGLVLSGVSESGRLGQVIPQLGGSESFVTALFGREPSRKLLTERLKRWRLTSPEVRHQDLSSLAGYAMLESVQGLPHPTLLMAGEEDAIATPAMAAAIARAMPRAKQVTIAGAGCLSMLEQPDAFNRAVTAFVEGLRQPPPMLPEAQPGGYRRRAART